MVELTVSGITSASDVSRNIDASIREYVGNSRESAELSRLGRRDGFALSFNTPALLLGSLWFGARGLWGSFLLLLIAETVAIFLIGFGAFGDFGSHEMQRAQGIASTIEARQINLQDAISTGSSSVDMLKRNIGELEQAHVKALQAAEAAKAARPTYLAMGAVLLIGLRLLAALIANSLLLRGFVHWRSNRTAPTGFSMRRLGASALCLLFICLVGYIQIVYPAATAGAIQLWDFKLAKQFVSQLIDSTFHAVALNGEGIFDAIKFAITALLTLLETILVGTPVAIVYVFIVLIAWRMAGSRVAILTGAALGYIILFDFWQKAMMTTALLGTAALICISVGVPVGILCGRNERVYRVVRPVLDFMQTMPSFVYLIPVIAFFGTGKTPAIIATMTFGMPPVIRLTTLGIRNVPHSVREAAISFGANKRYLLWHVDLPMAAPSIMAGVNQTILLCLSMVVVASLIGAKGLGEDVLVALQYAAAGDGVLSGLAILCCAIIFDRVVEGKKKVRAGH